MTNGSGNFQTFLYYYRHYHYYYYYHHYRYFSPFSKIKTLP